MSEKSKLPLTEAEILAAEVVGLLTPFCERIKVLGSIRRRKPMVGDVELGLIPLVDKIPDPADLFGEASIWVNRELDEVNRLCEPAIGVFSDRLDVNGHRCRGEGVQRLFYKGFALDLFTTRDPKAWGVLELIRTGSKEFNQRVVTQKVQGGTVLPMGMRFEGGRLWDRGRPIPTPTEKDVFDAIGLEYVRPENRHA